jgi:pimeloyl-ACP methyl ester carboxylesterase
MLLRSILAGFALLPLVASCGADPTSRPAATTSIALSTPSPRVRPSKVRSADGVELAVEETGRGDGPAIVFVHGLGFSRDVWRRQLDGELATRFHLVAYDLRGHGRSSRPEDAAAYEDGRRWGEDLHAVLEATHATSAVVVGWSLGGLAIAEYLRGHGDAALGGVVFVDAVTAFAPELFTKENGKYMSALTASDDGARKEATERFARACFAAPPPASELGPWLAAAGVLPASVHTAIQHMNVGEIEPALRGLSKPTLVVQGRSDELVAPAMARYTASIVRGARESVYEGSGHAPFVDETRRFDQELAAFVEAAGRMREQR